MIVFEIDICKLTQNGIEMKYSPFIEVKELESSSMIDWLIMNEMLIVLINSFDGRVTICEYKGMLKCLLIKE